MGPLHTQWYSAAVSPQGSHRVARGNMFGLGR